VRHLAARKRTMMAWTSGHWWQSWSRRRNAEDGEARGGIGLARGVPEAVVDGGWLTEEGAHAGVVAISLGSEAVSHVEEVEADRLAGSDDDREV
jgi:hypothetical protein